MNILTPSGYKNIMSCSIGDEVIAYDMNDGHIIYNTIEAIEEWNSNNDSEFSSSFYLVNDTYTMYKWQSVWANGNVTHVNQLKVGDIIYDDENQDIIITSITPTPPQTVWYRLEISGDHSYIADGITLHNASRFWVGGTGTWDASSTTNWSATTGGGSGASVPGAADTVTFDGSSGTGTVTLNTDVTIVNITIANTTNVMTFNFATNNNSFTLTGNFTYTGGTPANRIINYGSNTITIGGAGTNFSAAAIGGGNDLSNCTLIFTNTTTSTVTVNLVTGSIGTVTFNRGASTGINQFAQGPGTITNLNDIGTAAHTLRFQQGRTWTIGNFNVRGSAGNLVTVDTNGTAAATLTKLPLGVVNTDYITSGSITGPVNVTPATLTWYAGANSNPSGSGWITSSMPPRKMGSAGVG